VSIGASAPDKTKLPKIFNVNWFRKGPDGKFLWPGYGDNIRVLKWIFERAEGTANAVETPIGLLPVNGSIDISGLSGVADKMDDILKVDKQEWLDECDLIAEHQAQFGDRLPKEMSQQFEDLKSRLNK
jgi:phosphoenolpyruvate carboxykinase (GTP)